MNWPLFISRKIAFRNSGGFSAFIIRIAMASVALSVAVMLVAGALVSGFQTEVRQKVFSFWAHLQVRPYALADNFDGEGVPARPSFYLHPENYPVIHHIQQTAYKAALLQTRNDFEGVLLKGAGADFDWKRFTPYLREGAPLPASLPGGRIPLLVSRLTAARLQLHTHDKLTVVFPGKELVLRPFVVQGIYETGIEEFDREMALVPLEALQQINHWGADTVGGFEVFLKPQHLFKTRAKAYFLSLFGSLLPDETFKAWNQDPLDGIAMQLNETIGSEQLEVVSLKELRPGLFDWLDLQTMNELIILALMLAVAVINMVTTLLILILDRSEMIGVLKALGAGEGALRQVFSWMALWIIGCGLLMGNVVGLGLCWLQQHYHFIRLPQESYYLAYAPIHWDAWWIFGVNIGTVLLCFVLLQLPVYFVRRISIIKAIRFN
ncbi:MAG: FtsX-like permease family protein [Chitinophagales bacterium]